MRMKSISRSLTSGTHSLGLLNSSPIAIGVLVCGRQLLEVADVLRAERVFEEEQLVRLQVLGQLHRQDGRHPLVDVVQQLDLVAELLAQVLEQLRHGADVRPRLPAPAAGRWLGPVGSFRPLPAAP